jgi:cation transport regulator ChaC
VSPLVWQACRLWIYLRRGRVVPAALADRVWYFAYGSNMNERLFRERRHMTPIETRVARLDGYRLRFAVAGGRKSGLSARLPELFQRIDQVAAGGRKPGISAPADIAEAPDEHVWGVLYLLPLRKFVRLDASEGRQYAYLWVNVEDQDGRTVHALTYRVPYPAPEGRPSRGYFSLIREAAKQRGLPSDYRAFLDRVETRE